MRLAWLTDIHLNFLAKSARHSFYRGVAEGRPDAVLIGGDIAESHGVCGHLKSMAATWGCPTYFVLGNHDFYRSGLTRVGEAVRRTCREDPRLAWLSEAGVVPLDDRTALIGHDGWADGRLGDYARSSVMLNDYVLIDEFAARGPDRDDRRDLMNRLGDRAAAHIRRTATEAAARFPRVLVLTHVPPFREATWHEGRISDDEWLPHFSCKAVGDALSEAAAARPSTEFAVLCGHTHSGGIARVRPNLLVRTGGAVYGAPEVQGWIDTAAPSLADALPPLPPLPPPTR